MDEKAAKGGGQWFKDDRYKPQQQAEYLNKLSKLRSDLIQHENTNVSEALSRFQANGRYRRQAQKKAMERNMRGQSDRETLPDKHRRLLLEKAHRLQAHRKGKPSPKIDVLKGEKALDNMADTSTVSSSTTPGESDIGEEIAKQRSRLEGINQAKVRWRGASSKTKSPKSQRDLPVITPNNGWRALKQPGKLLPLRKPDDGSKDVRPQSKADRLRKRSKQRQLIRGDTDELDLCPESYKLDTADRGGGGDDGGDDGDNEEDEEGSTHTGYSVPTTTPTNSAQGDRSHGYFFPGDRTRVPLPMIIPYAQSYRLRHLRRRGLVRQRQFQHQSLQQVVHAVTENQRQGFKPDLPKTKINPPVKSETEKQDRPNPKNCILCEHPELMPQLIPVCTVDEGEVSQGDTEDDELLRTDFVHSEDNNSNQGDSKAPSPSPAAAAALTLKADIHIPQVGIVTPSLSPDSTRTSLSGDMPNIIFCPPTPVVPDDIEVPEQEEDGSLRQTAQQKRVRDREIKNLLEDLHELNGITQVLEKTINIS